MRTSFYIISCFSLPLLVSVFFTSCVKDDWKESKRAETELLENYLRENNISEDSKTEGGIYFIEEDAGTGLSPANNDYVVINYVGRYLVDGSIHETNYYSLKADWANSQYYTFFVFAPLKFRYGFSIPGINEGLAMMKEGGKATLIIPSDKAFYDFNPLEYEVELLNVIKDPVAWEDSILAVYIAENGYDSTTLFQNIYFRETLTPNPGDTRTVQPNDTVIFRYTGRYVTGYSGQLNDTVIFDTNTDDMVSLKLVYGKNEIIKGSILAMPKGLVSALDSMRAGTHATAVLPFTEAFGTDGLVSGIYGYTIVPRYQTVIYDIILEDIRPPLGK